MKCFQRLRRSDKIRWRYDTGGASWKAPAQSGIQDKYRTSRHGGDAKGTVSVVRQVRVGFTFNGFERSVRWISSNRHAETNVNKDQVWMLDYLRMPNNMSNMRPEERRILMRTFPGYRWVVHLVLALFLMKRWRAHSNRKNTLPPFKGNVTRSSLCRWSKVPKNNKSPWVSWDEHLAPEPAPGDSELLHLRWIVQRLYSFGDDRKLAQPETSAGTLWKDYRIHSHRANDQVLEQCKTYL